MDINKILEKLDSLFSQNKTDDAEIFLTESLESAISEGDTGAIISVLNELIGLYRDTSQFEKAVPYCGSLEKLIKSFQLDDNINGATSYLNIANLYRASGDYDKSFAFYKKIRQIYDKLLDEGDYLNASYYNNISLLYQETGNFDESCNCLEKALAIIKKLDAPAELASTYANLSLSYLHAGNIQKAEENALKSLEIFERDEEKDFHYSSALSAMGDVMTVKKDYPHAVQYYEKALEELHRRTGYTKSYRRLLSNLESVSGEKFTGIYLAEQYYNRFGKSMIEEKFPDYADKIAVGIAGEGSDCYGFDDRISRDHDFGCGFCMWLDDETYNQIGNALKSEYDKLPEYFRGFPKLRIRRGVFKISDFTKKISRDLYDTPEYALAELTNGKIFRDDSGIISGIREKYSYYPENVRNAKLAQALAQACQDGQCNYPRAMARGDILNAQLLLNDFANDVISIAFILNGKYMPHRKWLVRAMENFEILPDIQGDLIKLFSEAPDLSSWNKIAPEEWYGKINHQDFHINIIEKICSDIAEALGFPQSNYLESVAKEIFSMNIREQRIKNIVAAEWNMFDKVQNIGGRASCQDDFETFDIMRKSQYMTWNDTMLESYLADLNNAQQTGRNLISEKYARMMEYTSPEEYKKISAELPEMTSQQRDIINQIAGIQAGMMDDFAEKYPKLANNARNIHSSDDNQYDTSYETYLKGELSTYSPDTLTLYGRFIVDLYRSGKNLAEITMLNTVKLYGYKNLDDAENKI